jgi:hypothetical protein
VYLYGQNGLILCIKKIKYDIVLFCSLASRLIIYTCFCVYVAINNKIATLSILHMSKEWTHARIFYSYFALTAIRYYNIRWPITNLFKWFKYKDICYHNNVDDFFYAYVIDLCSSFQCSTKWYIISFMTSLIQ